MSSFICDICGGTIKMQAKQTGVCQGCGMEYDIDAIRKMASDGMSKHNASTSSFESAIDTSSNTEIDRNALLIYLNDVRILESIIEQSNDKMVELKSSLKKSTIEIEKLKKEKSKLSKLKKPEEPVMQAVNTSSSVLMVLGSLCAVGFGVFLSTLGGFLGIIGILLAIFMIISCIIVVVDNAKEPQKKYNNDFIAFNQKMEEYEKQLELINEIETKIVTAENKKLEKSNDIEPITNLLNDDINNTRIMLDKAYSANIIPIQFRNIEGVFYLYDYLSSSNQSLSEALMQANLDAIKQKMCQMIKLQATGIIQQAQTNAKLDSIQKQNNQILMNAKRISDNSELTAKYAAIAAINSEISTQILKRELAYHRADFWLK